MPTLRPPEAGEAPESAARAPAPATTSVASTAIEHRALIVLDTPRETLDDLRGDFAFRAPRLRSSPARIARGRPRRDARDRAMVRSPHRRPRGSPRTETARETRHGSGPGELEEVAARIAATHPPGRAWFDGIPPAVSTHVASAPRGGCSACLLEHAVGVGRARTTASGSTRRRRGR